MSILQKKVVRELLTHKAQVLAVIVMIALGVGMYIASYDSYLNLRASYDQTHVTYNFADVWLQVRNVDQDLLQKVKDEPDVETVETRLVLDLYGKVTDTSTFVARIVGVPENSQPNFNKLFFTQGEYNLDADSVLVENHFANYYDLHVGDSVRLTADGNYKTYKIAGTVISPEYIWNVRNKQEVLSSPENFGVFYLAQDELQRLAGAANLVDEIMLSTSLADHKDQVEALRQRLVSLIPTENYVDSYTKATQPANELLSLDLDGFSELAFFFPMLFLTITGFTISIMMTRMISQQSRQIGVLKANGFSKGSIMRHYLTYGIFIAIVGSAGGVVLGLLLANTITTLYTGMLSIPVTITNIHPSTYVVGVLLAIFACLFSTFLPARSAANINPADSLRNASKSSRGSRLAIDRFVPFVKHLPSTLKIAIRNIDRNKKRSFFTILGVMFSMVLVLASWGMIDAVQNFTDRMFNDIYKEDLTVTFKQNITEAEVSDLKALEGVNSLERGLIMPVNLEVKDQAYSTILIALPQDTYMHGFFDANNNVLPFTNDSLYLGQGLKTELGLSVGDTLKMSLASEGIDLPVAVSFDSKISNFVNEPIGSMVYVTYDRFQNILKENNLPELENTIYLKVDKDKRADIRARLGSWDDVLQVQDSKVLQDLINSYMTFFFAFVGVMVGFGAIMAFGLLFNTMTVSILERSREFATLRTLGFSNGVINMILTIENMLLTIVAIPFGLWLGHLATVGAFTAYNSDLFQFEVVIFPRTYIIVSVVIIVTAFVSQLPAMRSIARIDLARMIKDRTS
ncbi:FtsX-like permease family protein [candidate division WWE3 bacterium]|uniref:FtsX-like permease family protein n=1 Tax=candidate division WWE3 bacterium TaxID=2053526 RepID=A0A955LJ27_UNCKA|nr:FtsX-like permease family protein [candidate division WWE3 bacterium]